MQIARLTPALRLATDRVAQGDAKSIHLLLKIIDRLDRYSRPAGQSAVARPDCLFPAEQVLENAQNGKG
ncbi:MAG: hypothetical protein WAL59_05345 [Roseiarcus sp.]